ncbi:phosphodiesterase [Aquabacter spiritensis]|uniref:3',5'-cyclic AMP phosphodiesterase CpdA n=1 Tax=Aquabacter spiritensis TaxID=933073 RepID=A0A4R3LTG6_9HYPH|nr:phosphodiesterase [Aquabacter spiritensis]TCT03864.1 3',5'-cyclic AMP phosphodiesterase CpdA [Aquabacter spiritensis]
MLIAQLTDTHIRAPGSLAYGVVDTAAFLEDAVAHLAALRPRPDVLIVTGDLTDFDRPEEYARFKALTAALPMPVFPIPGNHDSAAGLAAAFPDIAARAAGGKLNYAVDDFPVRLVMLDSSVPTAPHGELGDGTLAWLDAVLAAAPARPSLVALHHPPFATGIRHMDVQNLRDAAALETVLRRHGQVLALVCGHVHRTVLAAFAGRPASICPSPAHAVSLDLDPAAPPTFHMEPPGLHLHRFADGGLVTHLSFVGAHAGPYPFFGADKRMLDGTA